MSHNKIKVGGQSPSASGEILVALDNLSNVSASSPSEGDVLKYTSGAWATSALSAVSAAAQYILIGQGGGGGGAGDNHYDQSTTDTNITNGQILSFYDTSPLNTIAGASLNKHLSTDWINGVTLPAGEYWVLTTFRIAFNASGLFGFRWKTDAGGIKTNIAYIGEDFASVAGTVSSISGSFSLSSSDTIELNAIVASDTGYETIANQDSIPAEFSSALIIKME